ncbi:hypothetical protein AKUH3B103M_PHAGE100070 (plasmid) [Apilactobacillus kunkeei]|nr:hypothetical protein AKUH3B103M_PHAGE100070 [Apilactobacillus kunkeei]
MFDFTLLIGKIKSYDTITMKELSTRIGIKPSTLRAKLHGKGFKQSEIVKICEELNIADDEIPKYFFTLNVELNKTLNK